MHLNDERVAFLAGHPRKDVALCACVLQVVSFAQVCFLQNFHGICTFGIILFEAFVDRSKGTVTNFLPDGKVVQRARFRILLTFCLLEYMHFGHFRSDGGHVLFI